MNLSFPLLALAMVIVGSLFVIWPLWRAGEAVAPSGADVSHGSGADVQAAAPRRLAAVSLSVLLSGASMLAYVAVGQPRAWLEPGVLQTVAQANAPSGSAPAAVPATEDGAGSAGDDAVSDQGRAAGAGGPDGASGADGIGADQIAAMVARLAQRLQVQTDDADGWRMLARSYETLRRFDEAVQAYQRLMSLRPPDADVLVDYAVALGMSQGQTLRGEPEAVLARALHLQPAHPQALALSGSAAFERQDYARAVAHWQKLLSHIPPGQEMRSSIEANIDRARALAATQKP